MDAEDYAELAGFWEISLKNARLSPETIRSYLMGVSQFGAWCAAQGHDPELTLRSAEAWTAGILDAGLAASTAVARQLAIRRFSAWLAEQEPPEIPRDLLLKLRAPKLDKQVVDFLPRGEVRALLAACAGKRFVDIRDVAIIRFMVSTGARAEEVIQMKVIDVQIDAGSAVIIRGKGGKGRRVGYGLKTAEALARYSRIRKRHPLAGRPEFWLAERRRVLNYQALYAELARRAARARIENFHPHRLRHSMAVNWMTAGGSVTGLMAQGGWTNVALVQRYIETASEELAIGESHRLDTDDF